MTRRSCVLAACFALAASTASCSCKDGEGGPFDAGALPDARAVDSRPEDRDLPDSTRPDVPPIECDIGIACTPDRGCPRASSCLGEMTTAIGGADDPITGHPDGATQIETQTWIGGYCTEVGTLASGGCDPDVDGSCGDCGVCLNAGTDSTGASVTLCAATCTPSVDASTCRDGYECLFGTEACVPGCSSDDECAVYRAPTGELVYDVDAAWTCNPVTYRCEHTPPDGAEAGLACTHDGECELRGRCFSDDSGFPGGYCTRLGCDRAGNECAGDGICQDRAFGVPLCLAPCEVGAGATAGDPFSPSRDCRAGYACSWDGTSPPGPDDGGCIPGNFNDVRVANVGATCDSAGDAAECASPYGLGQCRDWDGSDGPGGGYCTVFDCGAPGVDEATACGDGAVCASVMGAVTTLCLATCADATECSAGYGCWDTSAAGITTGGRRVCFAGCRADADCRAGETCAGASTTTLGTCE